MQLWLIFIASGLAAGFMAGLLGIGGGFVVVPVLMLVLPQTGLPQSLVPHVAIGTSLLCICITAISSAKAHHSKQAVDWSLFKLITPGLIAGTILGSTIAGFLSGTVMIIIFVSGAIATAVYLLSGHAPSPHSNEKSWPFVCYGGLTGTISSIMGIGGGSILVPYLVYKGRPVVKAVGTAAACGIPIALFGSVGYAISGWTTTQEMALFSGYLYWPAFLGIVIFSTLSAPLGAKVAHLLPEKSLRVLFALFLFFTSGQIIFSHNFH